MNIEYVKIDPTKNITILVKTPIKQRNYKAVADMLMSIEPDAEQVGFIENAYNDADIHLHMAGGEFCGNATLSAAALYAYEHGIKSGKVTVSVNVLGVPRLLDVDISGDDGRYSGTVDMPLPIDIAKRRLTINGCEYTLPMVYFDGIAHAVIDFDMSHDDAQSAIGQICKQLECDALGLMLYNESESRIDPLVYVSTAGTTFWESSCASGTTAVGAWMAYKQKHDVCLSLHEPGGILCIEAHYSDDRVSSLKMSGHADVIYTKTVEFIGDNIY